MALYANGFKIAPVVNIAIPVISTEAALDNCLKEANIGKLYQYSGETGKYKHGCYYKCVRSYTDPTVELTVEGKTYGFTNSTVLSVDQDVYTGPFESTNMNQHNTQSFAKIKVSGVTQLVVWINSYAESNYDYTVASNVDASTPPTSDSGSFGNTKGFQKNPRSGLNTTYWKKLTYTLPNTNEHFVYVVFRKDTSVNSNDDKGYFIVERPSVPVFEEFTNQPSGLEPFHTENNILVRSPKNITDISNKFLSLTEIDWQALYFSYFRCGEKVTGVINIPNVTKVGSSGMFGTFASTHVSGLNAPSLVEIAICGMKQVCQDTLLEGELHFNALTTIGLDGLKEAFQRTLITKLYFPVLNSCNVSGLEDMLTGCTTCTQIHFKSGSQSLIQSLNGYSNNFGAENATIYFDL